MNSRLLKLVRGDFWKKYLDGILEEISGWNFKRLLHFWIPKIMKNYFCGIFDNFYNRKNFQDRKKEWHIDQILF